MIANTKVWTKAEIKQKLEESDYWLERGLLAIFDRQTSDEKYAESTKHLNDVGFNAADARKLSSMAKQKRRAGWLSQKQIAFIRSRLPKYAGQLARIANGQI